jgi:hypothetical protein
MRRPRYIEFMCLRGHKRAALLETNDDGSPIYEVLHGHEVKPLCLTCHLDNRRVDGVNIESESMAPLEIGGDLSDLSDAQRAELRGQGSSQTRWEHS